MNAATYKTLCDAAGRGEVSFAEIDVALANLASLPVRELKAVAATYGKTKAEIVGQLVRRVKERLGCWARERAARLLGANSVHHAIANWPDARTPGGRSPGGPCVSTFNFCSTKESQMNAVKIQVEGVKLGRGDAEVTLPPEAISLGTNGRKFDHDEAAIAKMVHSYCQEGQLAPVQVRRLDDGSPEMVLGYGRLQAALQFNAIVAGEFPRPDWFKATKAMKIKAVVVNCDLEHAFRKNVTENKVRNETTDVDDAHNQNRFRTEFGWDDDQIAKFYGWPVQAVRNCKKILDCTEEVQKLVHDGWLSWASAILMLEFDAAERKEAMAEIAADIAAEAALAKLEGTEQVTEEVKKTRKAKAKNKTKAKAASKVKAKAKSKKMAGIKVTIAEVKKLFDKVAKQTPDSEIGEMARILKQFVAGKLDEAETLGILVVNVPVSGNDDDDQAHDDGETIEEFVEKELAGV